MEPFLKHEHSLILDQGEFVAENWRSSINEIGNGAKIEMEREGNRLTTLALPSLCHNVLDDAKKRRNLWRTPEIDCQ